MKMSTHGTVEITDPVEEMLKKTGCIKLHYKVQECIAETQDWRKCQDTVSQFKKCMEVYTSRKQQVGKLIGYQSTKMVIIVRTDLKMGRGKIAVQVAHAAILLYDSSLNHSNPYLKSWMRFGQPKIVLKVDVDCENILQNIFCLAKEQNLTCCMVRDAGRTQLSSGIMTAVGIGPNKTEEIDKITSSFKLL